MEHDYQSHGSLLVHAAVTAVATFLVGVGVVGAIVLVGLHQSVAPVPTDEEPARVFIGANSEAPSNAPSETSSVAAESIDAGIEQTEKRDEKSDEQRDEKSDEMGDEAAVADRTEV